MAWISIFLAFFALTFFLFQGFRIAGKDKQLPPGPKGFPIFGSLHLLGKSPHRNLHQLAKKYGPIMHMRLGLVPTIVVSSPEAAELFLKTHDLVFASKPPHESAKHMSYGQKNMTFAPYGSYWRTVRKICTLELLSNMKINSFKSVREEELGLLLEYIKGASQGRVPVDLSAKISAVSADISCRMVFGKKFMDKEFDERGFKTVIQEGLRLSAVPNLADYIPQLAALDLQGLTKRMKAMSKVFDNFLEKIVDEHIQSKDESRTKDFVDVMLGFVGSQETEYKIGRDHVKANSLDMLVGSMDTSATAVDWVISELLKHPGTMKKVQKELEEKVGLNRTVEEYDLESLEYLDMVIKETFRLHPVAPLLLPRQSKEDCIVNGFFVPKDSHIIVNAWAISRDPNVWTDPEKFLPERFEGNNVDIRGRDFRLLPFGAGRRGCPGMQLGLLMVRLMVAQLVHCFDWELPDDMLPADLDMTEEFSLVSSRAKDLLAIPTYRLHIE